MPSDPKYHRTLEKLLDIVENPAFSEVWSDKASSLYYKLLDLPGEQLAHYHDYINNFVTMAIQANEPFKPKPLTPDTMMYRGTAGGVSEQKLSDLGIIPENVLILTRGKKGQHASVFQIIDDLATSGNLRAKATRFVMGYGVASLRADPAFTFYEDQIRIIMGKEYDAIYMQTSKRVLGELFDLRDGRFYSPSKQLAESYEKSGPDRLEKRKLWFENILNANMYVEGILKDPKYTPEVLSDLVTVFDSTPAEARELGALENIMAAETRLTEQGIIERPMRKPGMTGHPEARVVGFIPKAPPVGAELERLKRAAKSLGIKLPKKITKGILGILIAAALPLLDEEEQEAVGGLAIAGGIPPGGKPPKDVIPEPPVPEWGSRDVPRLMPTPEELAELEGVSIIDDPPQIPSTGGPPVLGKGDLDPNEKGITQQERERRIYNNQERARLRAQGYDPDNLPAEKQAFGLMVRHIEQQLETLQRQDLATGEMVDLTFDEEDALRARLPEGHPMREGITVSLVDDPPESPGLGGPPIEDKPKTVGHIIKTKGRAPKKSVFVKVFQAVNGRSPSKAELKELVKVWKSLNNRDSFELKEIIETFANDPDPATRVAVKQLDMALLVDEYDIAEKARIGKQKRSRVSAVTGRETETAKKIGDLREELARTEAAKATMSGRGEDIKLADTNIKRIKARILRLLKSERGAVEIPSWLQGASGRLHGDWTDVQEVASGPPVLGTKFPTLTEEDILELKAEDARRRVLPREEGTIADDPLTPEEARRVKEQERIIQAAKDAKRRQMVRGGKLEGEDFEGSKTGAERRVERASRRAARSVGQAKRSTFNLKGMGNAPEYLRRLIGPAYGPTDNAYMHRTLEEIMRLVRADNPQADPRLIAEFVQAIEDTAAQATGRAPQQLEWLAGGPDDPPLWMRNLQAMEEEALRRRGQFVALPGGKGQDLPPPRPKGTPRLPPPPKGTKRLPPPPPGTGVGAPIPKGATIETYPRLVGGKRYTTKPTGIHRPVAGEGALKGLGRTMGPAGAAIMIPDFIKSLIESGDWKEAAQAIQEFGPAIYPGIGMGVGGIVETDPAALAQRYAEDKPVPFGTTRSEKLLADAAAAKSMAERSGYEVTEEFGSGAVMGKPTEQRILLSDEEAMAEALELMGIK